MVSVSLVFTLISQEAFWRYNVIDFYGLRNWNESVCLNQITLLIWYPVLIGMRYRFPVADSKMSGHFQHFSEGQTSK